MQPYVPLIMPELQAALIDPLPEVRATAARALGALLHSMGDGLSKSVMPWLLQTLKSEVQPTPERPALNPEPSSRCSFGEGTAAWILEVAVQEWMWNQER